MADTKASKAEAKKADAKKAEKEREALDKIKVPGLLISQSDEPEPEPAAQ